MFMELYEIAGYSLVGFCATVIGGFWGLGGGVFIVPALLVAGVDAAIVAPASLLQMLPSTFLTVRKQFPEIGWGKGSWGRCVALPLCTATFTGGFFGRPLGVWLREVSESASPRQAFYLILISFLFYKTISDTGSHENSCDCDRSSKFKAFLTMVAGFFIGIMSSLLGIGGGSITRPVMASVFKMPEKPVGQIARFSVFVTAVAGTLSYLFPGSSTLEKSDTTTQIITLGLTLAAGGVFGFPLGAKMHSIVLKAGRAGKARRGYAILLALLFICIACKLAGQELLSQIVVLGSGVFVCSYLIYLTKDSQRIIGINNEDQSN